MTGGRKLKSKGKGKTLVGVIRSGFVYFLALLVSGVLPVTSRARADFAPLLNPNQVANLSEFCNDYQSVSQIILLFNSSVTLAAIGSPTAPVTAALMAVANKGDSVAKVCAVTLAAGTASNTAGALRATKIANQLYGLGLENQIRLFEDTTSMYDFATNLKNSNAPLKEKLLNVNNYSRVLGYAFRNFPLDSIDARIEAQRLTKTSEQSLRLAEINEVLNGCRKAISPLQPGQVMLGGVVVGADILNKLTAQLQQNDIAQQRAAQQIALLARQVLKMLSSVITDPAEMRSAGAIVDSFIQKAFWVSVNYTPPPPGSPKMPGQVVVLPNEASQLQAPNTPAAQAAGVSAPTNIGAQNRQKTITVEDKSQIFYTNPGLATYGVCNNPKATQMEYWMGSHTDALTDPFIKGEWIAAGVYICPLGGDQVALSSSPITAFTPVVSQKKLDKAVDKAAEAYNENCHAKSLQTLYANLSNLDGLHPNLAGGLRSETEECPKLNQAQRDNLTPLEATTETLGNIRTMADFVKHYNDEFNNYINDHYDFTISESPLANTIRSQAAAVSNALANDTGYTSSNANDPTDGLRMNPDQVNFIQNWRPDGIGICDIPATLKRRYGNDGNGVPPSTNDIISDPGKYDVQYKDLVRRCVQESKSSDSDQDIFQTMFTALIDQLQILTQAKAEILKVDLYSGAFRSNGTRKPQGCYETAKPADIALANAKSSALIIESIQDLKQIVSDMNRATEQREKDAADRAEQMAATWLTAESTRARTEQIQAVGALNRLGSNEVFNYGAFAPSDYLLHGDLSEQVNIPLLPSITGVTSSH